MNISVGKFIGCVMIVVGSAIGAGIILLPAEVAGPGFVFSTITMITSWALLTVTGLLLLEMSLALPADACSFSSMAEKTLGIFGRVITWFTFLLFLYTVLWAYMAEEATLVAGLFESIFAIKISNWAAAGLFTSVFGAAVFWSTKAVDDLNRGLFSAKGFLLAALIGLMLPKVEISKLISDHSLNIVHSKYLLAALPVIICIFTYHFVIPSLRSYVGDRPKELKWIIISGTTACLIIYLLWIVATLGTVPLFGDNSFVSLKQLDHAAGGSDFAKIIIAIANSKLISWCVSGFFNVAMTTSFLGVALGLFDFLADGFKRSNTRFGRFQTALLTFIPPFIMSLIWPHGFLMAIRWSACFVAVLCLILPAIMVYQLRKHKELKSSYRAFGGNFLFVIIAIVGVILFVLPILTNMNLLPMLK